MKNIIAIDTSTEVCSAALQTRDNIFSLFDDSGVRNTEVILSMIEQLISLAQLSPSQLDAVTFARGPGSFTGVRVAAGLAQGIAYALDLPVVPVSTLDLLAQRAYLQTGIADILVINDARMQEIYTATYHFSSATFYRAVIAEQVCSPAAISVDLSISGLIVGTGWPIYKKHLPMASLMEKLWQINTDIQPHAESLLPIAINKLQQGAVVSAEQALPIYIRNRVATSK